MSKNVLGWFKIIGAGAAAAAGVIVAAPLTVTVGVIAGLSALTAAGATASALYQEAPPAKDANK